MSLLYSSCKRDTWVGYKVMYEKQNKTKQKPVWLIFDKSETKQNAFRKFQDVFYTQMSNESLYNTNYEQLTDKKLCEENHSETIRLNYDPIKFYSSLKSQIHIKRDKCHLCTISKL